MEFDQTRSQEINRKNKRLQEELTHWADTEYKNLFDDLPLIFQERHKVWSYVFIDSKMQAGKLVGVMAFYKDRPLPQDVEEFFKEVYRDYFPGELGHPHFRI